MIGFINFLPNWFLWALLVGSVVLTLIRYLIKWIPQLAQAQSLLQFIGAVMLAFSLFGMGVQADRADVSVEIAKMEKKVAAAELKGRDVTTKVVIEYRDRIRVIEGKERERIVYVDKYITPEDDRACHIPPSFRMLHDAAADDTVPKAPDGNNPVGPKVITATIGPKAE